MTAKRRIVTGFEHDVHTPWRRRYCYTQRAGVCAKAKRLTNRRERRESKDEIADQAGAGPWRPPPPEPGLRPPQGYA